MARPDIRRLFRAPLPIGGKDYASPGLGAPALTAAVGDPAAGDYEGQQYAFANSGSGDPFVPGPEDDRGEPLAGECDELIDCIIDGCIEEISISNEASMRNLSLRCLLRVAAVEQAACGEVSPRVLRLIKEKS